MSKAYLVGRYSAGFDCFDDENIPIGIFLNKEKAEKYVKENKFPSKKQQKMCRRCRDCDDYDGTPKDGIFSLADECELTNIGVDQHGKYCQNDKHDTYDSLIGVDYYMSELDLLD